MTDETSMEVGRKPEQRPVFTPVFTNGELGPPRPRVDFGLLFDWVVRLVPSAAVFSLLFAFDGGLRWLGLLGFVPLLMVLHPDCPTCMSRGKAMGKGNDFNFGPGH